MDEQVKDQNELQATDSEPAPGQIQKENISQHFMQHATAIQMSLHVVTNTPLCCFSCDLWNTASAAVTVAAATERPLHSQRKLA